MDFISENHQAIGWILLWAWIAVTIFLFAYNRPKSAKLYFFNLLLLAGFVYFLFLWE